MQASLKLTLVALAAGLIGVAAAPPSMAQTTALDAPAYGVYQSSQGYYNSEADFVRSINGTPCGMRCMGEAQAHWSQPRPNWGPAWGPEW
jgi:hypothetical protein